MRLAILVSHPIQYYGPLFCELARRVDLTVFFAHRATPQQQAAAGFGVQFEWDVDLLRGYHHAFLTNIACDPGSHHFNGCDTPEIGERLRNGSFNALLVMGWHLKSYWQGVWAAKRLSLLTMTRGDSHLDTPRNPIKRAAKVLAYPPLLRAFHAALYVGQRNRAYYEHYHYPRDRLFFSPHCVDTAFFADRATAAARGALRERLGLRTEDKAVLFAGKLVDFKRPLDLVDAAGLLRRQGALAHVVVAGAGTLDAAMRARAKEMDVPLHLLGFQNQTQMPASYAAADVLALPSNKRESWGLVANEALASGTPIVVSDAVGCAPDLAADGVAGRAFQSGNVAALADALMSTLADPPPKEVMKRISGRFSLSSAADGIEAAMQK